MLYFYKCLIAYLSQTKLIDKYCILWCKALFDYNVSCILLHARLVLYEKQPYRLTILANVIIILS